MGTPAEYGLNKQDVAIVQQLVREWKAGFPALRQLWQHRRGGPTGGGGTKIRLAQIAEVVTNQDYVTCSLLNQSTGIAATEGSEFEITVYARICGGTRLDRAAPKITIGGIFAVQQAKYDNAGTPEQRWYFVNNFQSTEEFIGENS